MEEVDLVPESQEPQSDSAPEDVVSVTLKRENSLYHSQRNVMRNGRYVHMFSLNRLLIINVRG